MQVSANQDPHGQPDSDNNPRLFDELMIKAEGILQPGLSPRQVAGGFSRASRQFLVVSGCAHRVSSDFFFPLAANSTILRIASAREGTSI